MVRDSINAVQFSLRRRFFGEIQLRSGLPAPLWSPQIENERQFYRLVLAKSTSPSFRGEIRQLIDIGCRNWSYARALSESFPRAQMTGIEVDGGRRYWNLYRRIDLAKAYAQELTEEGRKAEAFSMDFLEWKTLAPVSPALFSFFFPFVSAYPCLRWGLPSRYANFSDLLSHSLLLLRQAGASGFWLSAHQGEWEAEEARSCYQKLGFSFQESVLSPDEVFGLWPSPHETRIFFASKGL